MAKLSTADAIQIRDETIPNENTALRVGQHLLDIVEFVNLLQVPDGIITHIAVGDLDDFAPAGIATANLLRIDCNGADRAITGIQAPAAGVHKILYIVNVSVGPDRLQFNNNDIASGVANRFLIREGGNRDMRQNEGVVIFYDHTNQRWRQLGRIG